MPTRCPFAAVLLALVAVSSAAAQEEESPDTNAVKLPPIEVVGSIAPTASPIVGSGLSAQMTAVSGEEIDAWEPRLLPDALMAQTGVSMYDDLGTPYKAGMVMRGFNAAPTVGTPQGVSVFLDGVRQNEADAQEVNFDLLPLEHVKRVEVLRGNASLLGPNSIGGAVNLVTLRGDGPLEAEVEASGGNFGYYAFEGSLGGKTKKGWDYYLAGGYQNENGWREATSAEGFNGFLNLGRLGPKKGFGVQVFGAQSNVATAGSLPEGIFSTAPQTNFTPGDFENINAEQVSISGYVPVGPGRGSLTVYGRRNWAERFNVNQVPDPDVRSFTTNYTGGGNLDWRWSTLAGPGLLSLRMGVDGSANSVSIQMQEEDPTTTAVVTDVDSPSWDVAGYGIADYQIGRVTFSAGARYDYIDIPYINNLDPTLDTTSTYSRISPRGGISLDAGKGVTIYASAGAAFRAPAILELACADPTAPCPVPFALGDDPPLKAVQSTTVEGGAQWVNGIGVFTASLYQTWVDNDIAFVQSNASVLGGYFKNIPHTQRFGVELGAQFVVAQSVSVYANYAYATATYESSARLFSARSDPAFAGQPYAGPNTVHPGDQFSMQPNNRVNGGVTYTHSSGFRIGLEGAYTGSQWFRGDEANQTPKLPDYFVANVLVGYETGHWDFSGVIYNAFDSGSAVFGTYNENQATGNLERFLTPVNALQFKLIVRRGFGG